eukprot:scaffold91610_cov58-Attheya_sp.AAC.4
MKYLCSMAEMPKQCFAQYENLMKLTKVGQANTIAGFKATMYAWKLVILPEDIYEAQKSHIETVKKPYTMTMTNYRASEQVTADARREKNNKGNGSQGGHGCITGRGTAPGGGHGYQGRGRGQYGNKRGGSWTSSNDSHNEA